MDIRSEAVLSGHGPYDPISVVEDIIARAGLGRTGGNIGVSRRGGKSALPKGQHGFPVHVLQAKVGVHQIWAAQRAEPKGIAVIIQYQ